MQLYFCFSFFGGLVVIRAEPHVATIRRGRRRQTIEAEKRGGGRHSSAVCYHNHSRSDKSKRERERKNV